jgi:hypothetical protein
LTPLAQARPRVLAGCFDLSTIQPLAPEDIDLRQLGTGHPLKLG